MAEVKSCKIVIKMFIYLFFSTYCVSLIMIRTTFQFQLVLIFFVSLFFFVFFFDVVSFLKLNYPVILFLDVYKIIANDIGNHL